MELIRKVLILFRLLKGRTHLTIFKIKFNLKKIIKKYKNFQKKKKYQISKIRKHIKLSKLKNIKHFNNQILILELRMPLYSINDRNM